MSGSRVLRCVVAALIAAGAFAGGQAVANSFCSISGCQVRPPTLIPGYGGGGGGGGWGNDGNSGDPEREYQATWCMDFPHEVGKYGCDVYSPPPLTVNGCGASAGTPVPDFLLSPVNPGVAASFGGIFAEACNRHDSCYGTAGASKAVCDEALNRDMVNMGKEKISVPLVYLFDAAIRGQAWAYSRYLQWDWVLPWNSEQHFNRAQDEGYCRKWAAEYGQICR